MQFTPQNPFIVQKDLSILLDLSSEKSDDAKGYLSTFADLVKTPANIHTYQITDLSLWNACSNGSSFDDIKNHLTINSKMPVQESILVEIQGLIDQYRQITMRRRNGELIIECHTLEIAQTICRAQSVCKLIERKTSRDFVIDPQKRGEIKDACMKLGFPIVDIAGYSKGHHLSVSLVERMKNGEPFRLRDYQINAAERHFQNGSAEGGAGVVVLPCGAGKTIVGIKVISLVQQHTLILTTSTTAVYQWRNELLDKTTLTADQVGVYTAIEKEIKPVTIATYSIITMRNGRNIFRHFDLFDEQNWGMIIYDEVHVLPAPVFKFSAMLQSRRRLGLTATLVREDQRERDVFSLVGPKQADIPWKELEKQGWIAKAHCSEVRIPLPENELFRYYNSGKRDKYRIAAENVNKITAIIDLLQKHRGEQVLIIGTLLHQLYEVASVLKFPILTGKTTHTERDEVFGQFRSGELNTLIVSKIANFAIDLPDASVIIQISGTFGSRQEEAQRLGRILRPKGVLNQSHFYTLVSENTLEQEFSLRRQMFLCEQGYAYSIITVQL